MQQSWRGLSALLFSCALLFIPHPTLAQSPDKVIKQAIKAMSNGKGEKALRAVHSWQIKGQITRLSDKATGSYQAMAMLPNLYTSSFDVAGFEVASGFNGKSSWMRDSREGLRTLTGLASRDFAAEAAYRNARWLDYKKEKGKLSLAGTSDINGKPANAVQFTTAKGVKIKIFFDAATGLLVREELPAGETVRTFDYTDHRLVDGVLEAHTILINDGKEQFEIKLAEVKHNVTLDKAAFEFPKLADEPLPDIDALLKEVKANEDRIDELLEKYTYTETITSRELEQNGQLREKESETFELTFFKGHRIRRQTGKNGKPFTPSEEADEQKRVEKRIRDIEKKEAEKDKKAKEREVAQGNSGSPDPERGQRISISDVLRASKLVNPRRERFRGREVIVFDFEPLPGYKPQKDYEKFFGKMAGAIWVDVTDKQVARVEARLVEAFKIAGGLLAALREGASFTLEADRINDEIWLPTRADINLAVKVLLVKGINVTQSIAYGNYKRFNVDAEKEKLKDPIKP
ncbi:MAG: hypothetical protein HYR56_01975 [Acidobacteria bacterium]|nr:hypothetical protein [Acidobacteriota bacterium]MBI3421960.1 hypothetical protein [Acidobacteriota bacterium]